MSEALLPAVATCLLAKPEALQILHFLDFDLGHNSCECCLDPIFKHPKFAAALSRTMAEVVFDNSQALAAILDKEVNYTP